MNRSLCGLRVPQTGQRTFAAGYTAAQPQQALSRRPCISRYRRHQHLPTRAPPSPYQTASALRRRCFPACPQAARVNPTICAKLDKNRLSRDFGFFHFYRCASYLREIAGYLRWRPLFTLHRTRMDRGVRACCRTYAAQHHKGAGIRRRDPLPGSHGRVCPPCGSTYLSTSG